MLGDPRKLRHFLEGKIFRRGRERDVGVRVGMSVKLKDHYYRNKTLDLLNLNCLHFFSCVTIFCK